MLSSLFSFLIAQFRWLLGDVEHELVSGGLNNTPDCGGGVVKQEGVRLVESFTNCPMFILFTTSRTVRVCVKLNSPLVDFNSELASLEHVFDDCDDKGDVCCGSNIVFLAL